MRTFFAFTAAFALVALAHSFFFFFQFLKHLGDVATVLLDLVGLSYFCFFISFQTDWRMMRSDLCVEHWLSSDSLCKQKSHWIITINGKMNVWKCKLLTLTDTLQLKIAITDLNKFLAGENTSVLIILAIIVWTNRQKKHSTAWNKALSCL